MHCRERRRFWSDQGLSGQVVSDTDVVRLTPTMNSIVSDKVKGFLNRLFAGKKDVGAERYAARHVKKRRRCVLTNRLSQHCGIPKGDVAKQGKRSGQFAYERPREHYGRIES